MDPEENRIDLGVRLKGPLADVFEIERLKEGGIARSEMARTLILEALRARGHKDVKDPVEWGGYRRRKDVDVDLGQPVGVAAA